MKSLLDLIFKDHTGKYAVAQAPNLPLYIILFSWLLAAISTGHLHNLANAISHGAVFLWAYLEIRYGDSLFRRLLGAAVMIMSLWSQLN